jgi:hypothetical protein
VLVEPTISSNGTLGGDYAVAYDGVNGCAVPPLVRFRTFLRDRDQPFRIMALKTSFPRLWICSFGVEGPTCSLKANLFIISRSLINDSFHLNSGLSTQLARDIRDRPSADLPSDDIPVQSAIMPVIRPVQALRRCVLNVSACGLG